MWTGHTFVFCAGGGLWLRPWQRRKAVPCSSSSMAKTLAACRRPLKFCPAPCSFDVEAPRFFAAIHHRTVRLLRTLALIRHVLRLGATGGMTIERSKLRWNGWGWAAYQEPLAAREGVWAWLATELGMPSLLATPARPLEEIPIAPSRLWQADRHVLNTLLGADCVREDKFERALHTRGRSYHDLLLLRAGDLSDVP